MSQEQSPESSAPSSESPLKKGAVQPSLPRGHGNADSASSGGAPSAADTPVSPGLAVGPPMQKRRRVTRACDECRKKKIKCDGKQPCTHCQVYTYECTYDQPSNRRRNPDPQHVETLEARLRRATKLLHNFVGDINLDDPSLDEQLSEQAFARPRQPSSASTAGQESMLESMVENTGSLDLDDDGCWDFSGPSSGRAFLRHLRAQFGQLVGNSERNQLSVLGTRDSKSASTGENIFSLKKPPTRKDLPPKNTARLMCDGAFQDVCAVLRPVHEPTFWAMFDQLYKPSRRDWTVEERKFLALFYAVIALGAMFSTVDKSLLMTNGFKNAIDQGSKWYQLARSMTDVTDVRDLVSLQTVLFMVLFLQSSANLSSCYAHIGICLSSALRMGLHRSIDHKFDPIEQETRKRIFWCINKLDLYVGALLGLPRTLNSEDIDQEEPLEVDDEYITSTGIGAMPPGQISLMAGFNAHSRIVGILSKVVKYIYPTRNHQPGKLQTYIVSHARIREIEHDLQNWMEELPAQFKPDGGGSRQFVRIQHILRMAYGHIEMFLYRPFLHYISHKPAAENVDSRSYACAAACVNVSRNIVHLTAEMNRRKMLRGSYWFYMYTTFFAILSLLFYVFENPESASSPEILKDINEGKSTLAELAPTSLAADKCTQYLNDLFAHLSDRLKEAVERSKLAKNETSHKEATKSHFQPPSATSDAATTGSNLSSQNHGRSDPVTRREDRELGGTPSYDSTTSMHYQQAGTSDTERASRPATWSTMPTDQSVHHLGAMMFPSEDPFAYPTPPMITLENRQQFRPLENMAPQMYPPSSNMATSQVYDGRISDYPTMHGGQASQGYMQPHSGPMTGPDQVHVTTDGMNWQQQPQNNDFRTQQDYDNIFGEDWSAWGR